LLINFGSYKSKIKKYIFCREGTQRKYPGLISVIFVILRGERSMWAQLLGYLKTSRRAHGLLINFGSYKSKIKKYIFCHEGTQGTQRKYPGLISVIFVILRGERSMWAQLLG